MIQIIYFIEPTKVERHDHIDLDGIITLCQFVYIDRDLRDLRIIQNKNVVCLLSIFVIVRLPSCDQICSIDAFE